jgi:hypothetical protein
MRRLTRWSAALAATSSCAAAAVLACSSGGGAPAGPEQDAAAPLDAAPAPIPDAAREADADAGVNPACPPLGNDSPRDLGCTGLYGDLSTKQIAGGVREYTPAFALWSDGADKTRWIALPPGSTIDDSNVDEWSFPVGTRIWKEFKVAGHRVETRFFQKVGADAWVHASYAWAADELSATRADGADLTVNGSPYHIPTPSECEKCHNGRRDRVLGFDAVSLGLPDAVGLTLASLARAGALAPPPSTTSYTVGDDGSGKAAAAVGWLHVNCGVSCHNGNTTAAAYPTGLRLRLDPSQLTGAAPSAAWDTLKTTANVTARTPRWAGTMRIVPGQPDTSLLVQLISQRGTDQMPPLGTFAVDDKDVATIRAWISAMPPSAPDGG